MNIILSNGNFLNISNGIDSLIYLTSNVSVGTAINSESAYSIEEPQGELVEGPDPQIVTEEDTNEGDSDSEGTAMDVNEAGSTEDTAGAMTDGIDEGADTTDIEEGVDAEGTMGGVESNMDTTYSDGMSMDMGSDMYGGMYGDMGAETGEPAKDPILSQWPFVAGISSVTLVVSIVLGLLWARHKIKKGIELYED